MKTASSALVAFLAGFRPTADAPLCFADCFTITLASGSVAQIANGTVLAYTNLDLPVALNGYTYLANSVLIDGLKYKCSMGVSVDTQDVSISAPPGATVGGIPFLQALQQGLFDGAEIKRERAFFASFAGPTPLVPIGSVLLFTGRVTEIASIGRTAATVSVESDLMLIAVDMPRRLMQPNCLHVLYDGGCKVARTAYTFAGTPAAGSTASTILWSDANANFQQGAIAFTSGQNTGITATIKSAGAGYLTLSYPLPYAPGVHDAFSAAYGCDHTTGTCAARFGNLANFVGFPYLPPPEIITGPLAATGPSGGKG